MCTEHATRDAAIGASFRVAISADKVYVCVHFRTSEWDSEKTLQSSAYLLQQSPQQVEALAAHCLAQWGRGSVVTSDRKFARRGCTLLGLQMCVGERDASNLNWLEIQSIFVSSTREPVLGAASRKQKSG